ncbi:MAG TPA: deoxyribodipyrimidine photo-lyase [Steroidobacteraceae bacterium]|nr:deoxyribodipyrimidine photo-lyase [Steroidobacteraceae bacterium]
MTTLLWFRQDLRLADNPALAAAVAEHAPAVPAYIHTPAEEGAFAPGGASRWWLHRSLASLDRELRSRGSRLIVRAGGHSLTELVRLARECGATRVVWNRRYEPAAVARDRKIKTELEAAGFETRSFNAALLHEPWTIETQSGTPFQVFTAFWKRCKSLDDPPPPVPAPDRLEAPPAWPDSTGLDELALEPRIDWARGLAGAWSPGSAGARSALDDFLAGACGDYESLRDRPGERGTSRLSPHLHFGEIGPREVWHGARRAALDRGRSRSWRDSAFLTELGWREFAHHLLFHFPRMPEHPLRSRFERFPWQPSEPLLDAWQHGATGYPLVDAGMRQLWRIGWMHNRVRMIAGSFLVKDLLQPWSSGARWFWDTLVDADLANNSLGWQWVAGCGADAAPYFRIFNPTTQATRFDPQGTYVREWIPELGRLPGEWIHQPWAAPPAILSAAGVRLGTSYPHRVKIHEAARAQALAAWSAVKG